MTSLAFPLVNGIRHSFSSIELKIAGLIFSGFKGINYSRTRTRGLIRGNSPDPLAKTRGSNEYKADCEVYLAEFNLIQQALQALATSKFGTPGGYGDVFFPVYVSYSENGLDVITDTLLGCTMDSTESSNGEGTDGTVRKFELAPLKILYNGIDDLSTPIVNVL